MSIDAILDELFRKLKDVPGTFPYLLNVNKKEFVKGKDWIYYSGPYWDESEPKAALKSFIGGKWLVSGEAVARFERTFSQKLGLAGSLMVNSGSSANLIMVTALKKHLKWNDGDEIIVSPVGFPTTVAPIVQNNLYPRFVDIEFDTLNFDLDQVEQAINSKTRAIFISPVLGNPMDFDRLVEISKKHNVMLVLDGCDSLGSKWDGKDLASYAFASSCSFYPAHHITTGEGGMVSSNDTAFITLARSFAWWGRDCYCVGQANLLAKGTCGKRFDRWLPDYDGTIDHKYVFTNVGYNLKPLDLQGAIGFEQLKKLETIHQKRREIKKQIDAHFRNELGDAVTLVDELPKAETSWFGVPVICRDHDYKVRLVKFLEENKIQTRNYFAGNILIHPAYKHLDDHKKYPKANQVLDKIFFVGCHPAYNEAMIEYVGDVLRKFAEQNR